MPVFVSKINNITKFYKTIYTYIFSILENFRTNSINFQILLINSFKMSYEPFKSEL